MKRNSFIRNTIYPIGIFLILFNQPNLISQEKAKNPYGLEITASVEEYSNSIQFNPNMELVDLEAFIPGITLDIRYATENNFTGEQVYASAKSYLRLPAAMALKLVQSDLEKQGLALKIFDAYRPYAATVKFYEIVQDSNYAATPWNGSKHNRGCAVDVSLVDLKTGKELMMPTPFDDFSEKAASDYPDLPAMAIENRKILINAMKNHGFIVLKSEWWHFDYKDWEQYGLLDLSFETLDDLRSTIKE